MRSLRAELVEAKDFRVRDVIGQIRKGLVLIEHLKLCKRVPSIEKRLKYEKRELWDNIQLLDYFNEDALETCFVRRELVEMMLVIQTI